MEHENKNNKLKISKMSGKLSGIRAINTNPLDNGFCQSLSREEDLVCSQCYSQRMIKTYRKSCAEPWTRNGEILSNIIPMEDLPTIKDDIFRFHGHGELLTPWHLVNFYNIARKNPKTIFALWTKRDATVRMEANLRGHFPPENLIMIYSCFKIGHQEELPYLFDKTFTVIPKGDQSLVVNCGGKRCRDCMLCYSKETTTDIVEELK